MDSEKYLTAEEWERVYSTPAVFRDVVYRDIMSRKRKDLAEEEPEKTYIQEDIFNPRHNSKIVEDLIR